MRMQVTLFLSVQDQVPCCGGGRGPGAGVGAGGGVGGGVGVVVVGVGVVVGGVVGGVVGVVVEGVVEVVVGGVVGVVVVGSGSDDGFVVVEIFSVEIFGSSDAALLTAGLAARDGTGTGITTGFGGVREP